MINFFLFMILAVFVAGLMVGRTPEYLAKKVEAREMALECSGHVVRFPERWYWLIVVSAISCGSPRVRR